MGCGEGTDAHGRLAEKSGLVAVARLRTRRTLHSWYEADFPVFCLFINDVAC
jgi:hypothetical protein